MSSGVLRLGGRPCRRRSHSAFDRVRAIFALDDQGVIAPVDEMERRPRTGVDERLHFIGRAERGACAVLYGKLNVTTRAPVCSNARVTRCIQG
jgi:hypothetical protein